VFGGGIFTQTGILINHHVVTWSEKQIYHIMDTIIILELSI